jgi:periplasmic protein TonB
MHAKQAALSMSTSPPAVMESTDMSSVTTTNFNAKPSDSGKSPLPSTRLIRRRHNNNGWGLGVLIGVGVNAMLLIALVMITNLHHETATTPPMAMRMQRVEPPPPDEPEVSEQVDDESTQQESLELPALPLPPIEMASVGDAAVQLPLLPSTDDVIALPMSIPAFSTSLPVESGALSMPEAAADAFDEAAQLSVTFDLDRFYPRAAKARGIHGESTIRLAIDAGGKVTNCTLVSSSPPGVFEQAAERLGRSLRFRAAKRSGHAVPSTMTQHIVWTLKK